MCEMMTRKCVMTDLPLNGALTAFALQLATLASTSVTSPVSGLLVQQLSPASQKCEVPPYLPLI